MPIFCFKISFKIMHYFQAVFLNWALLGCDSFWRIACILIIYILANLDPPSGNTLLLLWQFSTLECSHFLAPTPCDTDVFHFTSSHYSQLIYCYYSIIALNTTTFISIKNKKIKRFHFTFTYFLFDTLSLFMQIQVSGHFLVILLLTFLEAGL